MRKFPAFALLSGVLILGTTVLWLNGTAQTPAVAQPAAPKGARWEYGVLDSIWYPADHRLTVGLGTPTQTIETKSWKELGTQLGLGAPRGSISEVLNALGNQGWELVSHVEQESGGEKGVRRTMWTFKRPK